MLNRRLSLQTPHRTWLAFIVAIGSVGLWIPSARAEAFHDFPLYPPDLKVRSADLAANKFSASFNAVPSGENPVTFLDSSARKSGWSPIKSDYFMDGGTQQFTYCRLDQRMRAEIERVTVTFPVEFEFVDVEDFLAGEAGLGKAGPAQAKVEYEYARLPIPREYKGFPLWPNQTSEPIITQVEDGEVAEYRVENRASYPDPCINPVVFGWEPIDSPHVRRGTEVFGRADELAIRDTRLGAVKITFLKGTAAKEKRNALTKPLELRKEVTTGAMIINGKYLRAPYVVEIKDNTLTLNGLVLMNLNLPAGPSFADNGFGGILQEAFERTIEKLELPIVEFVRGDLQEGGEGQAGISVKFKNQQEINEYLKTFDSIIRSDKPAAEKKALLMALDFPGDEQQIDICLQNWDGID